MKLQQLRYALEVYKQNLNVSEAAEVLYTSQPGISKQIRLLEEELGVPIFIRQGKRLISVTEPGLMILQTAERILRETRNIKKIGDDFARQNVGHLSIAFEGSRTRILPLIKDFMTDFPLVRLSFSAIADATTAVHTGLVDLGIVCGSGSMPDLCSLPCGEVALNTYVSRNHPLAQKEAENDAADYPVWIEDIATRAQLSDNNTANTFYCADAATVKFQLQKSDAVGILAEYSVLPDDDLIALKDNLPKLPLQIIFRRDHYLAGFAYDFIERFNAHWSRDKINQILFSHTIEDYSI